MSIISWEKWDSREPAIDLRGDGSSGVLTFIVEGTTDEAAALAEVQNNQAPASYLGMVLDRLGAKRIGQQHWEVIAEYTDPEAKEKEEPPAVDEIEMSFDTTGFTTHITHSIKDLQVVKPVGSGVVPYPMYGAIGVSKDGPSIQIEGVDIVAPTLAVTLRTRKLSSFFSPAYVKIVADLTGTMNKNPFRGFAAGELLFAGGGGTQRGSGEVDLTYSFWGQSNKTITQIGGVNTATPLVKRGWDYFWVYSQNVVDGATSALVPKWEQAHVAQVYQEADWSPLGLGV